MFKVIKIFIVLSLILISGNISKAQELTVKKDTTIISKQKAQTEEDKKANEKVENNKENNSNGEAGSGSQNENKKVTKVKEVKSARPDMSKSKGARPPMVVRPSGSRIPLGAGKPKGVGKGRVR